MGGEGLEKFVKQFHSSSPVLKIGINHLFRTDITQKKQGFN